MASRTSSRPGRGDHSRRALHDHALRNDRAIATLQSASTAPEPVRRKLQQQVVLEYLDVAHAVARRYQAKAQDRADLQQVAYVGLTNAVQRFEPSRGHDIVSFAVPTISGEIKRYLRDHTWFVRPPRRLQEIQSEARRAEPTLTQQLGREPSIAELAEALECAPTELTEALRCAEGKQAAPLDSPSRFTASGEPFSRTRFRTNEWGTSSEDDLEHIDLCIAIREACRTLKPRERRIVYMRFFEDLTQAEIACVLGVTQMQVSRLLRQILATLRTRLSPDLLAS